VTIISFKSRRGHLRHFHRYERAQASGYFRERLLIGESVVWGLPFLNGSRVAFRKKNNSTSIIFHAISGEIEPFVGMFGYGLAV
jgi:hypothetical protein